MYERADFADSDPPPWWVRPRVVYLPVLTAPALGATVVFYIVLPILIPGFVSD